MLLKYIANLNKNNKKYMIKASINGDTNNLHLSIRKKIDNIELLRKVYNLNNIENFSEAENKIIKSIKKYIEIGN